jgi:hypothetical protein
MPAQAGIQASEPLLSLICWIPAKAGMTDPCNTWQKTYL